MLTIGQLAAYGGVTVKAVRHYHKVRLLKEPERDASGYRRYSAQDAIDLVKIRTLADAGVPLARVKELLAADAPRFAAGVAEIDAALEEKARQLSHTRAALAQLAKGGKHFVSKEVTAYLARLAALGVSQRSVDLERELWTLMQAVCPEDAEAWVQEKLGFIEDPEFQAICVEHDAAFGWAPMDPRLRALADRVALWSAHRRSAAGSRESSEAALGVAHLIAASVVGASPAWDRLTRFAKERKGKS